MCDVLCVMCDVMVCNVMYCDEVVGEEEEEGGWDAVETKTHTSKSGGSKDRSQICSQTNIDF